MAPFEALYGRRFISPIGWYEVGEFALVGPDLVYKALEKVQVIRDIQKEAQSRPKSYANNRKMDLEFKVGYWVYINTHERGYKVWKERET